MSLPLRQKIVEAVGSDRVRVSADVTLHDLQEVVPSRELYVEPLRASQPLGEFLAEGGIGFGSLMNGTFAGQICRVSSAYAAAGSNGGLEFSYGLDRAPLYNVGYPLQRLMEGTGAALLEGRFAPPSEMVLRTRERAFARVEHVKADSPDLPPAGGAENVLFVNAAAAKAMGLPGAGVVRVRRADSEKGADAWARRFVLDRLPESSGRLLVLTQPGGAKALFEAHGAMRTDGVFIALAVHLGVLVGASARPGDVEELAEKAAGLPLTWRLR